VPGLPPAIRPLPGVASVATPAGIANPTRSSTTAQRIRPSLSLSENNSRPFPDRIRDELTDSGSPTIWARNSNGSLTENIGNIVGADRFYDLGYTGGNSRVANIEGGTGWREHETLDWIPAANVFALGGALNESTDPSSLTNHATATSMNIAGKAPSGASDLVQSRGIAYGIPAANFYQGNMAHTINGSSFSFSNSDLRNTYYRAIVEGVGPNNTTNAANRVDVVSSSWGSASTTTRTNLSTNSRIIDAVAYVGNQSRGSTVVFSAGNSGPSLNTVGNPATGFNTLVVGALGEYATDSAGTMVFNVATNFSSRGPVAYYQPSWAGDSSGTNLGNVRARVDIAAPGMQMRLAEYNSSSPNPAAYTNWNGTSFSAPTVAGGVALLADYAWSREGPSNAAFAVDGRVIKAVLINSADKTAGWDNGQSWNGAQWSTSQGLDYATGGGRMNLDQAFAQYANVSGNAVTQLINPTRASPHSVLSTGWARATINQPNSNEVANVDFVLSSALTKNTELNATLSWFAKYSLGTSNGTLVGYHNLDLEVWLTDGSGNPTTRVGISTAAYNNTEHLSFLVPHDGQYLIRVLRPAGDEGTYYSFDNDTTNDIFGLAWMTRPGLQVNSGTTNINSGTHNQPNILIAPESGETATLGISGSSTRVNSLNRLFVGGTDRGAGGTGTLNISSGATVDVSNRLRVFPGSTLSVASSTLTGGTLEINTDSRFTISGNSAIAFSTIDLSSPLEVSSGANATVRSFRSSGNANTGRLNILTSAATFDIDGQLTLHPVLTGSHDLIKNGTGTLILAPTNGGRYTYTGTTQVNAGTLRLGSGNALRTGSDVTVASGATFDIGSQSNSGNTAIGTLTVEGGTFLVPSGSGEYHLNRLVMSGGTVDFTGSNEFKLHFRNSNAAITTLASTTGANWIGSNNSYIQNSTASPLPITVENGSADIDLDAGIRMSNAGSIGTFVKLGEGTMRLMNVGNSANFIVQAGHLRIDHPSLASLGSGNLTLDGGTLTYGNSSSNGSTAKAIGIVAGSRGSIEVLSVNRSLELSGQISYPGATLTKTGPGRLVLSGTTTGDASSVTVVSAGVLELGASHVLPDGGTIRLSGGTLSTGESTGYSDTVGTLELTSSSTLALGIGSHTITFTGIADNPTGILTITGWSGSLEEPGTAGRIQFTSIGSNPNSDYESFLRVLRFTGQNHDNATFLFVSGTTYELVPVMAPEPATVLGIAFLVLALGRYSLRFVQRKSPITS
jgi:autotransporter-associated beta strand protein